MRNTAAAAALQGSRTEPCRSAQHTSITLKLGRTGTPDDAGEGRHWPKPQQLLSSDLLQSLNGGGFPGLEDSQLLSYLWEAATGQGQSGCAVPATPPHSL